MVDLMVKQIHFCIIFLSLKDETGAIFIDRDPVLFRVILNFLRNRSLSGASGQAGGGWSNPETVRVLLHEAEYYGLSPLIKQLNLCADLETWAAETFCSTASYSRP